MSSTIFFTADTHFQHDAIRHYCVRPFSSCDEMDKVLINNWNAVVNKQDIVYHLGDVFFGNQDSALCKLKQLKGKKFLVPGNHDQSNMMDVLKQVFDILPPLFNYSISVGGQKYRMTLCHYAMLSWERSRSGALMLHGHTHGRLRENNQRLDVGMDCWSFYPIKFEDILKKMKTLPQKLEEGEEIS